MTKAEGLEYEGTDERAAEVGQCAYAYIMDGEATGLPLGFRGVDFYGVVAMLRENDETFHREDSPLSPEERTRLAEIELDLEEAVACRLQFYPFGHDFDKYKPAYNVTLSGDIPPTTARRASRLQIAHSHAWDNNKGRGERRH